MTDFELLQAYTTEGEEDAFTELVNRYLGLVYSAALRQAPDASAASEITQSVFIILARKATTIRKDAVLAGWLLRTTRFTAANARRREHYRQQMEQRAMENVYPTESESVWNEIAPLLDEALAALGERDRDVLALRFFSQKSYKEIGAALASSEESARKRVSRAMDKLRAILAKRGKALPAAAVGSAISAHAVTEAPTELASTVAGVAMAKSALVSGSIPLLARATLQSLKWLQWKAAAIRIAAVSMAGTIVLLMVFNSRPASQPASVPSPVLASRFPNAPGQAPGPLSASSNSGMNTVTADKRQLLLRVVDSENGKPVPNARLTLTWITSFPNRETNVFSTDPKGECTLPVDRTPVSNWNWRTEVFKDGYVPKYVSWSAWQGDAVSDIPAEYTLKLARSIEIGGLALNDKGDPVNGVRVVFSVVGPAPATSHDRERLTMMGHYHTELTDAQGRWHCNHVPAQFSMITYEFLHTDYLPATFGTAALGATSSGGLTYLPETDLRNGSATFVLKPGFDVSGLVTDEGGHPIPNAKVTENRQWREPSANRLSENDGRFRFRNLGQREAVLTVQAEGFAPKDLTLNPAAQREELRFVLSKGGPLRGRVVDEAGAPIDQATLQLAPDTRNRERSEWRTKTDEQGKFEWLSAPTPKDSYTVEAAGYSETRAELTADGGENVITLHKAGGDASFTISGIAVDAETRQPIDNFEVLLGTTEGGKTPSGAPHFVTFSPEIKTKGKSGRFSFNTDGSAMGYFFEVRAEGYWPAQLTNAGPLTANLQLGFQLKTATDIVGTVQLPDGTPAEGAVVMLCTANGHAYMKLPGQFDLTRSGNTKHTETDAQGRFSFKPKLGIERIRVAHKEGYGEATLGELASTPVIELNPWGRVEGILRIGNRVGAGETIWLGNWYWRYGPFPSLQLHMEATTDANGHFVFEGVPPGEREVCHQLNLKAGKTGPEKSDEIVLKTPRSTSMMLRPWYGQSQRTLVRVEPGRTTQITLGGTGRTLVGTVKVNGLAREIDWQRDVQNLSSKSSRPPAPKREDFTSESAFKTAQTEWSSQEREFWLSETGRDFQLSSHQYVPLFDTNGSFRIDDVLPGTYQLSIHISDPTVADSSFSGKSLGSIEQELTVPEASDGSEQPPIDLGVLELQPAQ